MPVFALFALSGFALTSAQTSIRGIDFRNRAYPFKEYDAVPNMVRWMPIAGLGRIVLKDGRHAFVSETCGPSPQDCPLLTLDKVQYGEIKGVAERSAVVVMTYHTGGTATWKHLYVVIIRAGKPQVVAWLEAGSRADRGLRKISFDRGDLVLTVNDPNRRIGDCCSSGSIRIRYRWRAGSFQQVGREVPVDDPR